MTLQLPQSAQEMIKRYLQLQLGGKTVGTPYYMNLKRAKDLRVMVGKGTPEEIEMESKIWAKLKGTDFDSMTAEQIKEFLQNRGIGIDCSGFVMHVLNEWYKDATGHNIWLKMKPMNRSVIGLLAYLLKPVEKLGAEIITNEANAIKIEIKDVLPGDLVRSKALRQNGHHVLLVIEVEREGDAVKSIKYANAHDKYGKENGVRFGIIKIKDQSLPLEKQEWIDNDESGVNHVFEGYMMQVEDNGLRRVKAMEKIEKKEF